MKIEVFTLCDAATENQGKLNILGTFDYIYASKIPVIHPACSIALRLRCDKIEESLHSICMQMVNPDGIPVFQSMKGNVAPRMGEDVDSVAVNLILNFQNIKFDAYADYQINLTIDDVSMASLPLRVRPKTT